jgi:hypothetical protein
MDVKLGDKIVCARGDEARNLKAGNVYTINKILRQPAEEDTVIGLADIPGDFFLSRFTEYAPPGPVLISSATDPKVCPVITIDQNQKSAAKNDKEKVDLSLIPYISQIEHAKAFMVGEKKYGRYNYCKGHKTSQLIAAAQRHLLSFFNGESHDPIDGQHHLGSVMACCSMLLRQQELGTLKDDRYKDENSKK